jgi:hypothetical protein
VKVRRDHLSGVLKEIGPDIVVVAEGPSRQEEELALENAGRVSDLYEIQTCVRSLPDFGRHQYVTRLMLLIYKARRAKSQATTLCAMLFALSDQWGRSWQIILTKMLAT